MIYMFGYQNYAKEISKAISKEHEITVIAQYKKEIEFALKDGHEIFQLDFDSEDFDEIEFGFDEYNDTIFVCSDDDIVNIFLTITIRAKNPNLNIVAITQAIENEHKLKIAGATKVISVESMSARLIFNIMQKPAMSEIFNEIVFSTDNDIKVAEIDIPKGSFLDGVHINDIDLKSSHNVLLFSIVDYKVNQNFAFHTGRFNQIIDVGDKLVIIGLSNDVQNLKNDLGVI